jgi:soluble lytic murein transglycosylase-like protein
MAYSNKTLLALAIWTSIIASAGADETPVAAALENPESPEALVALAVKYEHAEGMPRDFVKAAALYCRAARSGNANAQFALGWMYANGRGVPRDDSVAAQLIAMASDQGHAHAKEMLRYIHASTQAPLPTCLLPDPEPLAEGNNADVERQYAKAGHLRVVVEETFFKRGPIFDLVHKLASDYDVDPKLVLAVITVESGFNVHARSPKNAQGLMQLIPETAQRFRVKNAFDPKDNIKGGLAYLQWLLAYFKGDVPLVLAAYNAGEKAVERYRGIPPYPETRDYVQKITKLYHKPTHPYKSGLVKEAPFLSAPITRK